jgi:heme/copper-type cytochrome/quinol oxidase subunit 1
LAAVGGSGDHKVIGRLYLGSALVFGILVVTLGELFALEAVNTDRLSIFGEDWVFELFTLARLGGLFLLAFPLVIGLAMVVVPLQVGARSLAFPRAAAASYWGWLLGSILLVTAYVADGGPGGGSPEGVNLWIASMGLILVSLVLAAICLATTVFAMRTPGLTMDRVPMFAWSVAVASILWVLTLPALAGLLVIMYVDHRHAGSISIGDPANIYPSLGWVLRNPQIYVVAIPVLGFIADALVTLGGKRLKLRSVARSSIGAFGILSFGAFMVAPSEAAMDSALVVLMAILAVVPVLGVAASVSDGLRPGSAKLGAVALFAVGALILLVVATLAGAIGAVPGVLDTPATGALGDSIYYLGISNGVLIATLTGGLGGIVYWASKIGRQPANDKLALTGGSLLLVGGLTAVIPDLLAGLLGDGPELLGDYTGGMTGLNVVAAIGLVLVGLGALVTLVALVPLFKAPAYGVPDDPWEGQTLEWLTASPPPLENFAAELAPVTSAEPVFDLREEK